MANTVRYQLRGDTAANWEAKNPILLKNEPAYDITNKRLKFGDGVTAWEDLDYIKPEVINNLISSDTDEALSAAQGQALKALIDGKSSVKFETWLFTLEDGSTAAKEVALCSS